MAKVELYLDQIRIDEYDMIELSFTDKGLFSKTGYFRVKDRIFTNKVEAFVYASRVESDVKWNFHDDVFSKFDWGRKPILTLKQVYKERAQQLRDKYDYLSISFSGGSDSWTVLDSFLSNNIHVDEVFSKFAYSGTRKYLSASKDRSPKNIVSEYEYAVKPVLEYVQKNFPRTKITFLDTTDDYFSEVTPDDLQRAGTGVFSGMCLKRAKNQIGTEIDFKFKRVASVVGTGKLQVKILDDTLYTYFVDSDVHPVDSFLDFDVECFFWTPDMPEIVSVQAHTMLRVFSAMPNLRPIATGNNKLLYPSVMEQYDELIKMCCYPTWDRNTFQTKKEISTILKREEDFWIFQQNSWSVQSLKWSVEQYLNSFNDSVFSRISNGDKKLKNFASPLYRIGKL